MIKLCQLLPVNEGTAVPGALEGWLDPSGICYYVSDTHAEWAARFLKVVPPDESDINAYEVHRMRLMKELYDKGWVRVIIQHDENLIYFDTADTPWRSLSKAIRKWLYEASIHGVKLIGDKIIPDDIEKFREPPYRIQFGNKGGEYIDPKNIQERKR